MIETLRNRRAEGFDSKSDGSPVTPLDRAVEIALRAEIERSEPKHRIVGEEYGSTNAGGDWSWIIDPIDGTRQFAAGLHNFGVLIALCYETRPVVGVILQPWNGYLCVGVSGEGTRINGAAARATKQTDLSALIASLANPDSFDGSTRPGFEAVRAASRWNVFDGGCLGYASLAEGLIGVAINGPDLEPFDIAALVPVVEGAGGVITDWRGAGLDATSRGAIAASANPALHKQLLSLLNTA